MSTYFWAGTMSQGSLPRIQIGKEIHSNRKMETLIRSCRTYILVSYSTYILVSYSAGTQPLVLKQERNAH